MFGRNILIILLYTTCLLLCLLIVVLTMDEDEAKLSRKKRFLIWQKGTSRIVAISGFGVPVDLQRETVIIGIVLKAGYTLPQNASDITHPEIDYVRRKRSLSRWDIYKIMADATQIRGFGGKSCILRAICEIAHTPVDKSHGLFEEILHTIFTPSSTSEQLSHHTDNEYFAAQKLGQSRGPCQYLFSDCKASLMDIFTVYEDKIGFA